MFNHSWDIFYIFSYPPVCFFLYPGSSRTPLRPSAYLLHPNMQSSTIRTSGRAPLVRPRRTIARVDRKSSTIGPINYSEHKEDQRGPGGSLTALYPVDSCKNNTIPVRKSRVMDHEITLSFRTGREKKMEIDICTVHFVATNCGL